MLQGGPRSCPRWGAVWMGQAQAGPLFASEQLECTSLPLPVATALPLDLRTSAPVLGEFTAAETQPSRPSWQVGVGLYMVAAAH